MIDISCYKINFRGCPVTVMSEGLANHLNGDMPSGLLYVLASAFDTSMPDEPSGWYFQSSTVSGQSVCIERFAGIGVPVRVTRGKRARPGALGGRVPMTAS